MLGNLAVLIEAEDVKGDLLTGTSKIINCLQEYLVTVLECTDVVHRRFHISGCKIFHGTDKSVRTGAVRQIVLDVTIREQAAGGVRIAGSKGVDERQRLFGLALLLPDRRRLLGVFSGCFGSGCFGSGILGAASGESRAEHGKSQRERKKFFHFE